MTTIGGCRTPNITGVSFSGGMRTPQPPSASTSLTRSDSLHPSSASVLGRASFVSTSNTALTAGKPSGAFSSLVVGLIGETTPATVSTTIAPLAAQGAGLQPVLPVSGSMSASKELASRLDQRVQVYNHYILVQESGA